MVHYQGQRQPKVGFAVQVASLNQRENLTKKVINLQNLHLKNILINYERCQDSGLVSKVLVGPFSTSSEALSCQKSLKKKNITGFIVDLTNLK